MMLYPAMNELLEQIPSRYKLVNVVAARARHIATEAESEKIMLEDKPVSMAIREVAEGKLSDEYWENYYKKTAHAVEAEGEALDAGKELTAEDIVDAEAMKIVEDMEETDEEEERIED